MSLVISDAGESATPGGFAELWWAPNGYQADGDAPASVGWMPVAGGPFTGAAPTFLSTGESVQAAPGGKYMLLNSNGGTTANMQACSQNQSFPFGVPIGRQFSGPVRFPAAEYLFEVPIRVDAARGNADVVIGFIDGFGVFAGGGGAGLFITSRVAVNGGAWMPRSKRTNGGADFIDGVNTGIVLDTTWRKMGLRYFARQIPRMQFEINDVIVDTMEGTDLPTQLTGNLIYMPRIGFNNVAGTNIRLGDMYWRVRPI